MKSAVYRFFDASGDLLYVGVTYWPDVRMTQHAAEKHWWHEVEDFEVEWFENRFLAEDAEMVAIWEEQPRYNIDRRLPRFADPRKRANDTVGMYDSLLGYLEFVDQQWENA